MPAGVHLCLKLLQIIVFSVWEEEWVQIKLKSKSMKHDNKV